MPTTNKASHSKRQAPSVSVIMPVRNEASFIETSLGAMLCQDYPHDRYEIIVVDGMSTDTTRELVQKLAGTTDVAVRVLDNPSKTVPPAMNIGIRAATGDIIMRMDGHTAAPPEYIRSCVQTLEATGADNVGGVVEYVGQDAFSTAAGFAAQSPFGCGGAPARSARKGPVDTVSFGCWRREAFEQFGYFDEFFRRTQDSEFNYRTRLLGGTVWMNPEIRTKYFNRASPLKLAKQYFQYGFWKTRLMFKLRAMTRLRGGGRRASAPAEVARTVPGREAVAEAITPKPCPEPHSKRAPSQVSRPTGTPAGRRPPGPLAVGRLHWRHLIPPIFVIGMVASLLATAYQLTVASTWLGWAVGLAAPLAYLLACIAASLAVAARNGAWKLIPLFFVIFPILHLSWGTGFLFGLIRKPSSLTDLASSNLTDSSH